MFTESQGFLGMPVTSHIKETCSNLCLISEGRRNSSSLGLSGNRLKNISTCEIGWSNFSQNLRRAWH